ncbi:head GIN domain-containing protein [Hyalangium gracile]|uniref:head GIN domain-containing protein n=1 Tax=Hyalangium gracile TaxID=394092 RepID=UPI001CCADA1F|nr:head GIN domain-containing protein [Hyalangium gracile]
MAFVNRARWVGLSLWAVLATGCGIGEISGSGNSVEEERRTGDFVALEVSNGLTATIVVDPTKPTAVRVVGDDNLLRYVHTDSNGETLSIYFDEKNEFGRGWSSPNPLRVEVTVPRMEDIDCSGGGRVELSGTISVPSLRIDTSGGSKLKAKGLAVERLSLDISGGGEAQLEGQATELTSTTSGGSSLHARGLSVRKASLDSSGGGVTTLQVSDSLRVSASGGSKLTIVGRPTVLEKELSGGSTLDFE